MRWEQCDFHFLFFEFVFFAMLSCFFLMGMRAAFVCFENVKIKCNEGRVFFFTFFYFSLLISALFWIKKGMRKVCFAEKKMQWEQCDFKSPKNWSWEQRDFAQKKIRFMEHFQKNRGGPFFFLGRGGRAFWKWKNGPQISLFLNDFFLLYSHGHSRGEKVSKNGHDRSVKNCKIEKM